MSDAAPTEDGATRLGQVVSGRYRIQELLGEGGMGAVYLAEHTHMRKRVALKLLHPAMSKNEEVLARFRREAEAAAHIEHPNVAAATDFGETDDGAFFLVLEYIEGTSLRDALRNGGAMEITRTLRITTQISLALERAHAAGIVHRDLKPENVMLVRKADDPDFVKVLDFGIAKVEPTPQRQGGPQQILTRMGTILGTPEYMAPEQAVGEAVGPPADLYAVGVILYEMITGKHPFEANDSMQILSMHMIAPVPPMAERAPDVVVPPEIEAVVKKLLEKEQKNRYATARELIEAIQAAASACGLDTSSAKARTSDRQLPVPTPSAGAVDAFAKTSYGTAPSGPALLRAPPQIQHVIARVMARARGLPKNTLLAIAAGVPILVLLLFVWIILSLRSTGEASDKGSHGHHGVVATGGTTPKEPAPKIKAAPESKLKTAIAEGPEALTTLAKDYPEDPQVLRELALANNDRGRIADALRAVRSMVALGGPSVDPGILQLVIGAAGVSETSDEAFALLEGPLGSRGVDGLIELSQVKSSRQISARATRALARPEVRAKASAPAAIYLDMKSAKTCPSRRDLMDRAKSDGDSRVLAVLRSMKDTRGCGFMGMRDCWGCLRKDADLEDAIGVIESRGK